MSTADALLSESAYDDGDIVLSDLEDLEEDEMSLASDLDEDEIEEVRKTEKTLQNKKGKRGPEPNQVKQEEDEEAANPLLISLEDKSEREERDKNLWFGKGIFSSVLHSEADEVMEIKQAKILQENKGTKPQEEKKDKKKKLQSEETTTDAGPGTQSGGSAASTEVVKQSAAAENSSDSDSDSSDDEGHIKSMKKGKRGNEETDDFEVVPVERAVKRSRVLDPEGLALGTIIATSKKATRDLIDNSFNKRAFNEEEEELPDWFISEERKHRTLQVPVDRQTMDEYRQRQRELNARPIKKIAEAKARKRRRMLKKMEQAKKKAEAVVNTIDISEREKAAQLRSIYKKAGLGKEKRQVTYVVSKKGVGKKVRRPPGIKGQFKVVDGRMKKDMRGEQRRQKKRK